MSKRRRWGAGSAGGNHRPLTPLLGSVLLQKLRQRQSLLELKPVFRDGASLDPVRSPSTFTGSLREPAKLDP